MLAQRPSSRPSSARGSSAAVKWQSAGDAVVAAQRLRKPAQTALAPANGSSALAASKSAAVTVAAPSHPLSSVGGGGGGQQPAALVLARHGSAARHAAKMGDVSRLQQLIEAQPGCHDVTDENSVAPLHLASAYGHMSAVEVICNAGASLDRANVWGSTPIINAAHNAQVGSVRSP